MSSAPGDPEPDAPPPFGERIAAMRWRLVGAALALLFYALLWLAVAAGATALVAPAVVLPVLVLLIAGGNWLQHWLGISRGRAPRAGAPEGPAPPP